ncbi:MAG TPA: PKD domain-containing protein [Thermoanaerobaculia bacterium]|nr:PKD domain-containing protein [Thermoanaerobaculia bacterium]
MKGALLVLLVASFPVAARAQSGCPVSQPEYGMVINLIGCGPFSCPDSTALEFDLEPTLLGVQRPSYYELQRCDEVTWDFGDGSPPLTAPIGTARVTYARPVPGNYTVTATVRNARGSVEYSWGPRPVATEPAKLSWPRLG